MEIGRVTVIGGAGAGVDDGRGEEFGACLFDIDQGEKVFGQPTDMKASSSLSGEKR